MTGLDLADAVLANASPRPKCDLRVFRLVSKLVFETSGQRRRRLIRSHMMTVVLRPTKFQQPFQLTVWWSEYSLPLSFYDSS